MVSFRPFRELIKERGTSTYYLRFRCNQYNIGGKTLERLLTDQSVSTNTLDALCQIFECDISQIMEILPDSKKIDDM
ncbi:MAG: helix-turn-helix transcriptional regulator [Oscillospiraceae bacterium]|nr:helix-turn-helix transcriptional regulator [Oscillospiraceae bacterium]